MNPSRLATVAFFWISMGPGTAAQVKPQAKDLEFTFDVKSLGGRRITEQDFKAGLLLVDLWGTWCPPCRTAIPELVDLHRRYKHHGLEIVGLNYEQGDASRHEALVREFAGKHGIAYELALGTPEIRKQIPGFSGYPTLLFFKKGLEFDHLEVGFEAGQGKKIEEWIRNSLGLPGEGAVDVAEPAAPGRDGGEAATPRAKARPAAKVADQLAPGAINAPGDGDRGFDFEVKDPDGKEIKFADFRGKVVAVALLLAADAASKELASGLSEMQAKYAGAGFTAVGVCFGKSSDPGEHAAETRALAAAAGARFPIGLAKLDFIKKVHQASGVPIVLVFDREGVLKLRETGSSAEKRQDLEKKLREILGIDV